jgi:hypothetical protein
MDRETANSDGGVGGVTASPPYQNTICNRVAHDNNAVSTAGDVLPVLMGKSCLGTRGFHKPAYALDKSLIGHSVVSFGFFGFGEFLKNSQLLGIRKAAKGKPSAASVGLVGRDYAFFLAYSMA